MKVGDLVKLKPGGKNATTGLITKTHFESGFLGCRVQWLYDGAGACYYNSVDLKVVNAPR